MPPCSIGVSSLNSKIKALKLENEVILEVFNCDKLGKNTKNFVRFSIFGFYSVAKNIERLWKICSSYPVNNQIWLNLLLKDDYQLFFLQMDDRTLATNKNSFWKKYCFTSVIIQGSKAKVGSRSQRVCSHAQEDRCPLNRKTYLTAELLLHSKAEVQVSLHIPSAHQVHPLSSIKNYWLEGQ